MSVSRYLPFARGILLGVAIAMVSSAASAQKREFSFAYDQPKNSGYGIGAEIFNKKLAELSKGALSINQYPGAQLGTEAQTLQKVQTGDIDFVMLSTANASTAQPESGVFSIHYIFRDEAHAIKVLGDPAVIAAMKELYAAKMKGAHMLALGSQGLRHMYGKKPIEKVADLKGIKMRVQATVTEDTTFPAYGAQVVHMPFGEVYTSLQTGVVDMAENGINNYLVNKHYEPAPVLSLTEHEANNAALFVSDKVWSSLSDEQKKWVQAAADEISRNEPTAAFKLEHEAQAKLEKIGVKVVKTVDKSGFMAISKPIQDKLASDLGPNAVKVLGMVRNVQ
ncbi:TRAP transporter substrate-binding protein [Bradyrhizobium sp. AUGA SZCCT0283]|uniref:TRAP transporter substrate-binding protein n=1 Tax=Bradyrhizobium sp. AUGA SZCCT0283 TaxID=2807671 RepID=UPI001BAB76CE|nr:TRAP transporter substrate-binding protein [Bradyrhizobium sp. AUGA SZCCT0283]MBR1273297.1 TRAP transporter substrate-binding protein [Bradyrhizobium sp. AUGA SZCCT0283]